MRRRLSVQPSYPCVRMLLLAGAACTPHCRCVLEQYLGTSCRPLLGGSLKEDVLVPSAVPLEQYIPGCLWCCACLRQGLLPYPACCSNELITLRWQQNRQQKPLLQVSLGGTGPVPRQHPAFSWAALTNSAMPKSAIICLLGNESMEQRRPGERDLQ